MSQLRGLILYKNKYYCDLETHECLDRDCAIISASFSKTIETFDGNVLSLKTFNKIKAEDDWIIITYNNQTYILATVRHSLIDPVVWNICKNYYDIINSEFNILVDCNNLNLSIEVENNKSQEPNGKSNDFHLQKESSDLINTEATYQLRFCVLNYENSIKTDINTQNEILPIIESEKKLLSIDYLDENPFIKSVNIIPNYDYQRLEDWNIILHQEFKAMYKIFSKLIKIRYG